MDLTLITTIYGFGSYFKKSILTSDIDLLIIHAGVDFINCDFAILCKHRLENLVSNADVTMLSKSEEVNFQFINAAEAIYLGELRKSHLDSDLAGIVSEIHQFTRFIR